MSAYSTSTDVFLNMRKVSYKQRTLLKELDERGLEIRTENGDESKGLEHKRYLEELEDVIDLRKRYSLL